MGDRGLSDGAVIALGHLYAKSGHFMGAYRRLYEQVDTSMLTPALRADYLFTLYDFSRDLAGNSGMAESLSVPDRSEYAEELLALPPAPSSRSSGTNKNNPTDRFWFHPSCGRFRHPES